MYHVYHVYHCVPLCTNMHQLYQVTMYHQSCHRNSVLGIFLIVVAFVWRTQQCFSVGKLAIREFLADEEELLNIESSSKIISFWESLIMESKESLIVNLSGLPTWRMIQRLTEGGAFHPAFPFQSSMYYSDFFFLSIFLLIFFRETILLFLLLIHTRVSLFSSISFFVSTALDFTMSTSSTFLFSRWMSDTDLSFSEEAGQQVKTQKLQSLTY